MKSRIRVLVTQVPGMKMHFVVVVLLLPSKTMICPIKLRACRVKKKKDKMRLNENSKL